MAQKRRRLSRSAEFERVYRQGRSKGNRYLVLYAFPRAEDEASADGQKSGEEKAAELIALGADAKTIWVTREEANTDSIARRLAGVTGVWFGGGDQSRLIKVLRGTKTDSAIRARYNAGAVIGGLGVLVALAGVVLAWSRRRHGHPVANV